MRYLERFDSDRKLLVSDKVEILDIVKKITNKLKLKLVGYLGKGHRGKSFDCYDKVLKLTSDKEEVSFYINIKDSDVKYIVKSYGIYKLNSPHINESYVIVMDKLNQLNKKEKDIIVNAYIHFYYMNELFEDTPPKYSLDELDKWINENFINDSTLAKKVILNYGRIINEVRRFNGEEDECHIDNIGIDNNGIYKCFDITGKITNKINDLPHLNIW